MSRMEVLLRGWPAARSPASPFAAFVGFSCLFDLWSMVILHVKNARFSRDRAKFEFKLCYAVFITVFKRTHG